VGTDRPEVDTDMRTLFSKTRLLESKIDAYLDHTSEVGLLFREAIKDYLARRSEQFEERRKQVTELENAADQIRLEVERQLYAETLIPDARGDVLGILENTDEVINTAKETLMLLSVQRPRIPKEFAVDYLELADHGCQAVQELVMGVRAFFRNAPTVKDYVHKICFWEKEADKVGERLKRKIFDTDLELAWKLHLGDFVVHIDTLADKAEDVSERLSISAIKRSI
jgi:predicted phosphate transport protein (TIGR00153 family)